MQWCWRSGPECASEILSRRRANQAVPPPEARIAHLSNLPEHGGCCGMDVALILGNRACLGASSRWRVRSRVRDVTASGEIKMIKLLGGVVAACALAALMLPAAAQNPVKLRI